MAQKKTHFLFWTVTALAALAVGAVLYVLLLAASKPQGAGLQALAVGEMAALRVLEEPPEQTAHPFVDGEGVEHTLADFRGRTVVFNLWATWCQPCLAEMPMLKRLAERMAPQGVEIVLVSVDLPRDAEKARRQFDELVGDAATFYIDPRAQMQFTVESPGLPTTIIFDREGREIARLAGPAEWDSEQAIAVVEAAAGL